MTRLPGLLCCLALSACTADNNYRTEFDASAGEVEVSVLGDGFVRMHGERVPFEAAVLTLRQRARAMSAGELSRFVVHLKATPIGDSTAVSEHVAADLDRMLGQLQVMGITQVRYL